MTQLKITHNIVDIHNRSIFFGELIVENEKIVAINRIAAERPGANYILPGFIDSHVHVESSMLIPSEFARLAVVHGSVGSISDPHEIANVCGMDGVRYMIANGKQVPFKFYFGAPSCVPATIFETAGANLDATDVDSLLRMPEIKYLSEMMNFPGVLHNDEQVMMKIASAKKYLKPVDGHAPGLRGEDVKKYIDAGISTDHECFTAEEALEKLQHGMKILIREGSAAKNFESLIDLMHDHYENMMFCSDDKHPDSLAAGHINQLCARAVAKGIDVFKVLKAACVNPVEHYKLEVGQLKIEDPADMIVVKDLKHFEVLQTYIDGQLVAEKGHTKIESKSSDIINKFTDITVTKSDLRIPYKGEKEIPVIEALDGQLISNKLMLKPTFVYDEIISDTEKDMLKIVVVNRYNQAPVAKAFIKNFGLKKGAIASSVAHDSHNIVAIGTDDDSLLEAIGLIIQQQGGISAVTHENKMLLGLPVAGLMSNKDGYEIAAAYTAIDKMVKVEMGSTLTAPFMTLSFMALLVIPHLKLSDKGLFDGDSFSFI